MSNWTGLNSDMGVLDFEVKKYDAYALVDGEFKKVPHRMFTGRDDTKELFEAVGHNYRIWQNREGFDFLSELVDSGEIEIENTLEYRGGQQVGVVAKVPDHVTIGDDEFSKYLMWINNHDGKGSFQVFGTDVCIQCGNAFQLTKRQAKDKFTIPHNRRMNYRLQKAREAIKLSFKQTVELQELADTLIEEKMGKYDYNKFLRDLSGVDKINKEEQPKAYSRANGLRHTIHEIHRDRDYISNYRGTKWGVMQAVTDYVSNVKKYHNPQSRFKSLTTGPELNIRALELLTN